MKRFDVTYSYEVVAYGLNGVDAEIMRTGSTVQVDAETKEEAEEKVSALFKGKSGFKINACER